ncbi:pyruvate kinase [Protomyces lactucae-debilis]|uniref:Pyruvate kinase n=1 Tax=Protomyces lactucae-debilis TaxID=2754530 RepID=A0A1Y2FSR9_PROLT|nr:pyruvate kinase [Protomyces lactucae-debilis]ORY86236.1 pyruvate kinase [Protomyces lactucae-debilis]
MWLTTDTVTNNVQWLTSLNPETRPPAHWRRSSIICTIGPKTNSPEMMNKLRSAGMNVVRMNFSHGEHSYHQSVIDNARKAEQDQAGRPLAIALDTKGPEIRTGQTEGDVDIPIAAGTEITITCDDAYKQKCSDKIMYVDYKNICKVIEKGKIIFVDDGVLSFQVLEVVDAQTLQCRCLNNGKISSRKGVNLPGTDVDLPALSEKDKADLQFGVKNNVDMIFASFIRRGEDIKEIRKCLGAAGKEIRIIAKIENRQGVNNFDEILKETDGVMVARGDLGIEIPAPEVVLCQKMMIAKCNLAGKPVICATQMLESMTYNPRPTRAEISDVANAILDGADCVMLSGETAKGSYPVESVRMMHETTIMAETAIAPRVSEDIRVLTIRPTATTETVCCSAVAAAHEQNAAAIIVLSTSGSTARFVSKYRPQVPIIMVTRNETTARNGHLHRGVWPFVYVKEKPKTGEEWQQGVDERLQFGFEQAKKLGILERGAVVVAVQGWRGGLGNSNTLRILQVS